MKFLTAQLSSSEKKKSSQKLLNFSHWENSREFFLSREAVLIFEKNHNPYENPMNYILEKHIYTSNTAYNFREFANSLQSL